LPRVCELSATDAGCPLGPPQSLRYVVVGMWCAGPGRASRAHGRRDCGGPSRNARRRLFTSPGGLPGAMTEPSDSVPCGKER